MRLISVAAVFAAGAIVSRVLLAFAPSRFSIDLAQPIPVVTWWGGAGALFVAVLLLTIAAAFLPYVLFLRRNAPAVRGTIIAAGIALVAALAWLPLFSSDVYAYAAYGEMARVGINPYVHTSLPQTNELFRAAMWQWSGTLPICVYGTLFVSIATLVVTATQHLGAAMQLDAFRVLACIALLCSVYLLARCGNANDDARGRRAALYLGLNPVALWAAAEGHNDALMLALVLAGVALYRRNSALGAAVATLAATIKLPALLAGGTLAFQAVIRRREWRALGALIVAFAIVAIASIPLMYGAAHDLAPHGRYAPFASVQSLHPLLAVVIAIVVLLRARHATTDVDRFGSIALAAWVLIPNPYPWYALWLLPLGAWSTDRRIALAVALVCALALLRYIPDAVAVPTGAGTLALGVAALLGYTPLVRRGIIGRS